MLDQSRNKTEQCTSDRKMAETLDIIGIPWKCKIEFIGMETRY